MSVLHKTNMIPGNTDYNGHTWDQYKTPFASLLKSIQIQLVINPGLIVFFANCHTIKLKI